MKEIIKKNKRFLISIFFLMGLQAIIYFLIKFCQHNYHYINFSLDNKIPFISYFIYVYNMFYPFCFISFYYLYKKDEKTYFKSVVAGIVGFLICDIIFLSYPTIISRPDIEGYSGLTGLVLYITYLFDNPAINCFPSIHCLFCFLVIFAYIVSKEINIPKKIIICICGMLIIISTLFVKQHYIYDAIAALVICTITFIAAYKFDLDNRIINLYKRKKQHKIN